MEHLINQIEEELRGLATEKASKSAAYFVPGADSILGVRMPELNQLAKKYKAHGFELCLELWASPIYEMKMLAAKTLPYPVKKDLEYGFEIMDTWSAEVDNWAICDTLGMTTGRILFQKQPERLLNVAKQNLNSSNFWVVRMGLVYLTHFARNKDNHSLIQELISPLEGHKEKYVKKAIVWVKKDLRKFA